MALPTFITCHHGDASDWSPLAHECAPASPPPCRLDRARSLLTPPQPGDPTGIADAMKWMSQNCLHTAVNLLTAASERLEEDGRAERAIDVQAAAALVAVEMKDRNEARASNA